MSRSRDAADQINRVNSSAADATAITIDSSENVGIGTDLPSAKLHLKAPSGNTGLYIQDASGSPNLSFLDSAGTVQWQIYSTMGGAAGLDPLVFYSSGGERMRIDTSGNVGINVTSPSTPLHVDCGAPSSSDKTIATFQSQAARQIGFVWDDSASTMGIATLTNHSMAFHTNGNSNEAMRIDSSGNLLVGTTTMGWEAAIGTAYSKQSAYWKNTTSTSSATAHWYFGNSNGWVGTIVTSGSSTAYNTSSDYRLKTDAQPMTGASERVQALNPVNFEWIADGTRVDGFLAHEAATVVPEAINGEKDAMRDEEYEVTPAVEATYDDEGNELTAAVDAVMGTRTVPDMQGIDQSKLVPLLTAALQEALTKIDSLETRLTALEG